ncbi:MAG TPA: ferritin-like domain-containing protein [Gemmata sp.]|nr:ferritin-like domain-containing protein [Gemmata sp.]
MRTDDRELPVVRSSSEWVAYFRSNALRLLPIAWERGAELTDAEREMIAASLPSWQLGESSDGAKLSAAAQAHADVYRDQDFVAAIDLFIKEEQRHGAELGRFLDLAGVSRKTWDFGDAVFRILRHLLTRIELQSSILLMVEVHALIYYAAIRRATGSTVLRQICRQILVDEVPHVRFQCERLAIVRRARSRMVLVALGAIHRVLFAGTTLAIWLLHRHALRAGGFTFRRFWKSAWSKMSRAWRMMDPRAYRWPSVAPRMRPIAWFPD